MLDVKQTLINSEQVLSRLAHNTPTQIPKECVDAWSTIKTQAFILREVIDAIDVRESAWQVVENVGREAANRNPGEIPRIEDLNKFQLHGVDVSFPVIRHLVLTGYLTQCWSMYDRLTKLCGRVAGSLWMANEDRVPQLFSGLLDSQKGLGFGMQSVITACYWPTLKVSYAIRNTLVHEGFPSDSTLFDGDNVSDGFLLSNQTIRRIEKDCLQESRKKHSDQSCLLDDSAWLSKDLIQILKCYNAENDQLFAALTKWSVGSIDAQVRCFSERFT